jgi:hypothetical protein
VKFKGKIMEMKETILNTVNKLREEGIDFSETPALFTWQYEEEPNLEFQMLITEVDPTAVEIMIEDAEASEGHTLQ